ncbi:MAG: hypothetical protein CMD78_00920 [Gammaproteobacteria bacterium]|nr:hypothetical protein [Gammaproteobacteria bacterium]|tara:strand:+ start:204 stop:848 length:645 start_codon:yes stop_codon:yes gene_type:complete
MKITKRTWIWLAPALFYLIFFSWYTNLKGPLSLEEIDHFVDILEANGSTPDRMVEIKRFMEKDDGKHFYMMNLLDLTDNPPVLPATGPDASAEDLMVHYTEFMFPELFSRACHPIFFGRVLADALDLSGIENAESWDQAALFRYRSRRDMIAIVANPKFLERHDYKIASLEKTIANPVKPLFFLGDLRFTLGLILFSLFSFVNCINNRKPRKRN